MGICVFFLGFILFSHPSLRLSSSLCLFLFFWLALLLCSRLYAGELKRAHVSCFSMKNQTSASRLWLACVIKRAMKRKDRGDGKNGDPVQETGQVLMEEVESTKQADGEINEAEITEGGKRQRTKKQENERKQEKPREERKGKRKGWGWGWYPSVEKVFCKSLVFPKAAAWPPHLAVWNACRRADRRLITLA